MNFAQDFGVFWQHYPRRVGKLDAQKAYEKARKAGVSQQQLLDGIAAYVQHKPAYADWCHPATWLRQGRWLDEYDVPMRRGAGEWCQHEPRCCSPDWHLVVLARERGEAV